jgi:glycosyltransferase involved in cell wall biosynthesis
VKILHYIPTYAPAWQWGGPVRSVSDLCEALVVQGHDVTVFTTNAGLNKGDVPENGAEVVRNGVKVHYFPQIPGMGIKSPALEEAVTIRISEFDLLHVTAIWQRTGPAACRAARQAGVPYVISPRGALGPYSWQRGRLKKLLYYWLWERANLQGAAGFHYTSTMEAAECERFRFDKLACNVPNGLDIRRWSRNEAAGLAWRKVNGVGLGAKVLLYAGRLHHKKGLDLLPSVFEQLDDLDWLVAFVGNDDDGTGALLREQFAARRLIARVRFLPVALPEDLVAAYSAADVFLLPSRHENFGNVVVEAAVCGCRVLVSEETGIGFEISSLGAGERLPRSAVCWRDAIRRALATSELSPGTVESLRIAFSRARAASEIEKFYLRVVS